MKQFKELSVKEMQQVTGGNSSNPGTSNWINGMGQGGGGNKGTGTLNMDIGQCVALGLGLSRGPIGCKP